jgi:hypothetical protein
MSQNEKMLMSLIREEGVKGAVASLATALSAYADEMSDLGLKEKVFEASEMADILRDAKDAFEDCVFEELEDV